MGFLNQFASYFTPQERDTELYNVWSAIGVNMEKAFLEEQNKLNAEMSDINSFSEDTMRSWLAFFLQKIPYRTTATCQVTVNLHTPPSGDPPKLTTINKYDKLVTPSGIIYTLWEGLSLIPGDVRTVTAVQGNRIVETGTYNSLIKVQATNPDLTYITVKINDVEIPPVSYETSYDQLHYIGPWKPQSTDTEYGGTPMLNNGIGIRGMMYNVIADGECKFSADGIPKQFKNGDMIAYDGVEWDVLGKSNRLSPIQFTNSYVVPRNGYFAYYHNNYLFVKIFLGSDVSNPEGQKYEVSYIQSDGIQGQIANVGTNSNPVPAETLSFVSSYEDIDENPVTLEVSNTPSSPAVNQPSVGKLGLYLKQRLYSSINVSSVPEYTNWFNAQPEVGDCLVMSDYERWKKSGGDLDPTGIVNVYLVGVDGNPLDENTINTLLDRIEPYKDIAVLQVKEFTEIKQFIQFEYTSSINESSFEQYIQSIATQYYNLSYLQSHNSSIFDDLDLTAVLKDILENSPYDSTGLVVRGYHYYEEDVRRSALNLTIKSYAGELPGTGWYTLEMKDEYDQPIGTIRFDEIELPGTTKSCSIYYTTNVTTMPIGSHNDTVVSLSLEDVITSEFPNFHSGILKCYWGMENEGILSIGIENGLRKLAGVEVKRAQ